MATTGQKTGEGIFICKKCGQEVRVRNSEDTLQHCPKCKGTEFKKIG